MKRDHIFYDIFIRNPSLLFEIVNQHPPGEKNYRFDSVEVKQTAFRIDGVFLPPPDTKPKIVYFAEIQFQPDEDLHHRFFGELLLYLYRHKGEYDDWGGVLIYGSRSLEPSDTNIHRAFLHNDQITRIYLDELGDIQQQPIGLALMLLTIIPESETPVAAKFLVEEARTKQFESLTQKEIIDSIITIMAYKFTTIRREAIEVMLGVNIRESLVYQEAKEEGIEVGREQGREEGERSLVLRLLRRKFGTVPEAAVSKIEALSLPQLEELGEALLDFRGIDDLETWLQSH